MFKAVLIERDDRPYRATFTSLEEGRLPSGDVTVRVDYSTLNYKDALAITGKAPVVRQFPMVPGIDFAGSVHESENASYAVGDRVVLNGWGVGEHHWGGLAQRARVKGEWLIPLPAAFTPRQSMAIGTAGYTAMLCVMALERHGVAPDSGLSLDGSRWIQGRANFFLAVKPLSRQFRRLFLERLQAAFDAKGLGFFGDLAYLADPAAFAAHLAAVRRLDWKTWLMLLWAAGVAISFARMLAACAAMWRWDCRPSPT